MKEQYISPELHVVCFAPVERLANSSEFDLTQLVDIGISGSGNRPGVSGNDDGDFGLDIL